MGAIYFKCHHGNLIKDCFQCVLEQDDAKKMIYNHTKEEEGKKRIPILRGCKSTICFCTGKCREIVGYQE